MAYLESIRNAVRNTSQFPPSLVCEEWIDSVINRMSIVELLYVIDVIDSGKTK